MAAFDTFRRKAITVILESKKRNYHNSINPLVSSSLTDPKLGRIIPQMIATSPQGDQLWGGMSYAELKSKKGLKNMSKTLIAIQEGEKEPPSDKDLHLRWNIQKKNGYAYIGKFKKLEGDKLHILTPKGEKQKIQLNQLSAPAIAYAKMMAGQKDEATAIAAATKEENWTNAKGSIIKATFISLKEDEITLKLANGKETSFPLNLLSEESRKQAKSYAK